MVFRSLIRIFAGSNPTINNYKTMKRTILLFLSVMMTVIMTAGDVTPQQALQQAQKFLQQTPSGMKRSQAEVPQLKMAGRVSGLYVFNAEQNQGYVIVSNDDRTVPILGYSETGTLDLDNMPCNMHAWLQGYADEIAWLNEHNIQPTASQIPRRTASAVKAPIAPLVKTQWNQDAPYNNNCPYYKKDGSSYSYSLTGGTGYEHCATGCVATAMAQVMYYNQWPTAATADIPAYTWKENSLSLPATTFDWGNMLLSYKSGGSDEQKAAVATLMQYCGYSLKMDYGESSSASTANVATALQSYFDYATTTAYVYRSNYSYANWIELIYNELKQGRAVVYRGTSAGGGHSFVCDGYQGEDFFHFNWGWGGSSDDYFKLSVTNPYEQGIGGSSSNEGFIYDQGAVVGIQKNGGTGTVLNNAGDFDLVDNGVTFSASPTQYQEVEVTLNIENNGPDDFDGDIGCEIYYESSEDNWQYVEDVYCHAIIPKGGGTATVKFTPKNAGNYKVNIYQSNWYIFDNDHQLIGHIVSVAAGSPTSTTDNITLGRSLSVETEELISGNSYNIYGSLFKGTLTVTNPDPDNNYNGTYQCDLYDMNYSCLFHFVEKITVPANGSINIPIASTGLDIGKNYYVYVTYIKEGNWTGWDKVATCTVNPGIVTYQSDGTSAVTKVEGANYYALDDIFAVDITGAGITSATSAEPNCLFIIGDGDESPIGVGNVVVKSGSSYTATNIELTDGYDFYSPVDFTASNIVFTYNNNRWADGSNGWNTIMLPYDVTLVKADEAIIDWFHSSSDTDKQFWVKKFTGDDTSVPKVYFDYTAEMKANTPYIIALPGNHWGSEYDLSGKTIKFIGQNTTVHKSERVAVTGGNYRFVGETKAVSTENIYCINAAGNQFVLKATGGSPAFRPFFKADMFDRTVTSLGIGNGGGTTGIETMSDVRGMMSDVWYDLQGRRVENPTKGVYIKNGKLFIKK